MKSTRREFLKQAVVTGIAAAGLPKILEAADTSSITPAKSKVIVATDKDAYKDDVVNQAKLDAMMDKIITKLTGKANVKAAWSSLFNSKDVVGIKVNCLTGVLVSTRPEVVYSVIRGLKMAGVKEDNITIWDRRTDELLKCGFKPNRDAGVKVYGDDGDWGPDMTQGVFSGKITKFISEKCNKIINVPVLKTHGSAGISACLKNHYGSFNNPNKHHANGCNPAIADFNSIPIVKQKTTLCVVDALGGQYDGGPGLKQSAQFRQFSLIAGFDPVAVDTHCLKILQDRREKAGLERLSVSKTAWLQSSQERGVGICDPNKIDVIQV